MELRHELFRCAACNRTVSAREALNHGAHCAGVHVLRPVAAPAQPPELTVTDEEQPAEPRKDVTEIITLPMLFRACEIGRDYDVRSADERIPISLSSEAPVERHFGKEILDHSPSAVDLSRAANGLPLLLEHDMEKQVGRIDDVRLDGGKLVGMMRFSQRPEAQDVRQDILDDIRTDSSIGYRVLEMQRVDDDTYKATRWMPYEGSLVAVPADPSVGVGRGRKP